MQNINLCQVYKTIIKTRSKFFINQDFKDVATDRCYFKLRWKLHIIVITIYAVYASTTVVKLREDVKIVALFEKGELAPCLQLVGEKPGEEFHWYILWKGTLHMSLIGWKWIKASPERTNSVCTWKMIMIPQGNEFLPSTISNWAGQWAREARNKGVGGCFIVFFFFTVGCMTFQFKPQIRRRWRVPFNSRKQYKQTTVNGAQQVILCPLKWINFYFLILTSDAAKY